MAVWPRREVSSEILDLYLKIKPTGFTDPLSWRVKGRG